MKGDGEDAMNMDMDMNIPWIVWSYRWMMKQKRRDGAPRGFMCGG